MDCFHQMLIEILNLWIFDFGFFIDLLIDSILNQNGLWILLDWHYNSVAVVLGWQIPLALSNSLCFFDACQMKSCCVLCVHRINGILCWLQRRIRLLSLRMGALAFWLKILTWWIWTRVVSKAWIIFLHRWFAVDDGQKISIFFHEFFNLLSDSRHRDEVRMAAVTFFIVDQIWAPHQKNWHKIINC